MCHCLQEWPESHWSINSFERFATRLIWCNDRRSESRPSMVFLNESFSCPFQMGKCPIATESCHEPSPLWVFTEILLVWSFNHLWWRKFSILELFHSHSSKKTPGRVCTSSLTIRITRYTSLSRIRQREKWICISTVLERKKHQGRGLG